MALDQQLVRVCANSWCDLVGSEKSLAVERGGWDSVSQVIRLEGQNDTGLSLSIPTKASEGGILETSHAVGS